MGTGPTPPEEETSPSDRARQIIALPDRSRELAGSVSRLSLAKWPTSAVRGLTKAFNALAGWVPPVARMQKEAHLIRSQGEAQARYNMLMADAAARSDAENPEVVARAAARFRASLLREQSNLDEVILSTCDELDENPPAQEHDHGLDDDWLALLVDVARKRSEREIQVLLGKILAGEIRHPRLFSPRTVQTLATLTPRIAHNFERLCNASVSTSEASFVLFGQLREMNEALALLEMYYVDLMHLDHFGLVVSSNFADLRLDFFINGQPIDLAGQQVRLIGQEDYIRFDKVAILLFSDSGAELRRLIAMKPNASYMAWLTRWLSEHKVSPVPC